MPLMMTLPIARGMCVAEIGRHVHSRNAFEVADRAVHDQPGALRGLHDVVEEVVANDRASFLLAEQIHHQHVARLEHVDRGLVVQPADSRRLRLRVDDGVEVGTEGHELHGERAAYELLAGVKNPEAVRVLVPEALAGQDRQHFLRRQRRARARSARRGPSAGRRETARTDSAP